VFTSHWTLDTVLRQINPAQTLPSSLFRINFNIVLPYAIRSSKLLKCLKLAGLVCNLLKRGLWSLRGHAVAQLVEALCYKPEVNGFINGPNSSSPTTALGSTQPLTEMSTRNLPGVKGRPARKTDNLTTICEPIV
jgi:hypothetical protein